ncbi:LEA type 2 family protein [Daejeonella lutea]|uniref:Late embryogenesis abundant protein n=1 Tax=Daejeonella lutea TaxID=572036 RepID=A0A1T5DSK0_9SPHI|nr:LEA type 2 family protein [Daejeonella lutea]SKB74496.1 Late embryogenesis abundant protein [Daejeonella lutea]
MKRLSIVILLAVLAAGCGLNKQARQIEALEKCTYEISSADSIYLAGRDISRLVKNKTLELRNVPELALALFRKNIPLKARVNLAITNPTSTEAAINQFEYIVLIKNQEIANGFVNQKVSIQPGGTTTVPVRVNSNIYSFLSNGKTMEEILDFVRGGESGAAERKGVVTIKIKPTIDVGGKLVRYPGYITIDKEVSSKILF